MVTYNLRQHNNFGMYNNIENYSGDNHGAIRYLSIRCQPVQYPKTQHTCLRIIR